MGHAGQASWHPRLAPPPRCPAALARDLPSYWKSLSGAQVCGAGGRRSYSVLIAACSSDHSRSGNSAGRPGLPDQYDSRRGGRADLDRQLVHLGSGQLRELPDLQHVLRPRHSTSAALPGGWKEPRSRPSSWSGPWSTGRPALLCGHARLAPGRGECPLGDGVGHAAARYPQRAALRSADCRTPKAASASGTTLTPTQQVQDNELGLVRAGSSSDHRLFRRAGRGRVLVPGTGAGWNRRGVLWTDVPVDDLTSH